MSESNDSSRQRRDRANNARTKLAENIKQARLDLGLTQYQLAELAGLKQTLVSKMERGLCLTIGNLVIVAESLEVPLVRLFLNV